MSQISSRYLWQNVRPLVFVTTTTTTTTTTTSTTTTTQGCGLEMHQRLVSVFNVSCPPLVVDNNQLLANRQWTGLNV